jgi:hypothetical protein
LAIKVLKVLRVHLVLKVLLEFLAHKATRECVVLLVQRANVVQQESLETLVFQVHKEFKVHKANVVILVLRAHLAKKVLSVIKVKLVTEVQEDHLVHLAKKVHKEECLKKVKDWSKSY